MKLKYVFLFLLFNIAAQTQALDNKSRKNVSTDAYLKAKKACLEENKNLKGKDLKECIIKKQHEAK